MQFTKAEEYGILGVLFLAERPVDKVVPLSVIAEAQDVPEKFLAKIFQNLTKTGIVKSHRGVRGGFSLNEAPDKLTVRRIIEAIQGPFHLIRCLYDRDCCNKFPFCPIRVVLQEAEDKILGVFASYTVTDLINMKTEKGSS